MTRIPGRVVVAAFSWSNFAELNHAEKVIVGLVREMTESELVMFSEYVLTGTFLLSKNTLFNDLTHL